MLDGLEFMHAKKIYHGDIKLDNFMIQDGTVKYTDFGLANFSRV